MSGDLNLPEGVSIPGWFRRYLEARANGAGPVDIPPPILAGFLLLLMEILSLRHVETSKLWVERTFVELNLLW